MSRTHDRRWHSLDAAAPILTQAFEARGVTAARFVGAFPDLPGAGVLAVHHNPSGTGRLRSDPALVESVLAVMRDVGFSSTDIARSAVIVESQETVDRDAQGSWFFMMR